MVLDPFGGGGSTYQAAEKHHRNWIGIEIYDCKHIKKRLIEEFNLDIIKKPNFKIETILTSFKNENSQNIILRRSKREGV